MKYTVHKSLAEEAGDEGPGKAALVRCPHCEQHFYSGGTVSPEETAKEFDYEHDETLKQGERTRSYERENERHYGQTRGERGFAFGGLASEHFSSAQRPARFNAEHFSSAQSGARLNPKHFTSKFAGGGMADSSERGSPVRAVGRGDRLERQLAKGGEVNAEPGESFSGYLAKRHAARRRMRGA